MTPADRRITELIDKWLTSIDLHLKYVELSDAAYARAQPWPKHDRPTRWVLEVARQKILELKGHCETRQAMGDSRFAESLELMAFLANLVGIQHIQRFVPLADRAREAAQASTSQASTTRSSTSQTVEAPTMKPAAPRARPSGDDTTREMPRLKASAAAAKPAAPPASPAPKAEQSRAEQSKPAARTAPAAVKTVSGDLKAKMLADAVRLLKWGKSWHELAELIGRIADRPSVPDIRKFLRTHKAEIEARVAKTN